MHCNKGLPSPNLKEYKQDVSIQPISLQISIINQEISVKKEEKPLENLFIFPLLNFSKKKNLIIQFKKYHKT